MLELKFIKANVEVVRDAVKKKGASVSVDRILELDLQVHQLRRKVDDIRQKKNAIADRYAQATPDERAELTNQSNGLSGELESEEIHLRKLTEQLHALLLITPNIPDAAAPVGPDSSANVVVRKLGNLPAFDFKPLDHVDLVTKGGWADVQRIPEISGSRTYALKGNLVRLELALVNFALDFLTKEGFIPITVPPFAREDAFIGTGHFPVGRDDAYYLGEDNLFLIGTSEVILNALHADQLLNEADLPFLYAGYSQCFRREAGSGGRDVRGLLRVHHFTKVEQFVICRNDPAESRRWHERLLGIAESILAKLELPYQVVECSTGDMGLGKIRMHDVEAWVPSLNAYRETHSCSTLHEWQARRTNTRYRPTDSKDKRFVHTLNNTAIATPRIFAALLENHQQRDGRVRIPAALRDLMGGEEFL